MKIIKFIYNLFKSIVTLFLIIVLVLVLFQKITKNKLVIGDIFIFQIASESMMPDYRVGDLIVVKKIGEDEIKIGDDLTYLGKEGYVTGMVITHQLIDIREEDGKKLFTTKGISNVIEDPEISYDDIYGKVIYHSIVFSYIGRLMTNMVAYYIIFICVGISFAYETLYPIIFKDKEVLDEEDVSKSVNNTDITDEIMEITGSDNNLNIEEDNTDIEMDVKDEL